MKKTLYIILPLIAALTMITGCKDERPETVQVPEADYHSATGLSGAVIETMNTGGYTYVQVDTGSENNS